MADILGLLSKKFTVWQIKEKCQSSEFPVRKERSSAYLVSKLSSTYVYIPYLISTIIDNIGNDACICKSNYRTSYQMTNDREWKLVCIPCGPSEVK